MEVLINQNVTASYMVSTGTTTASLLISSIATLGIVHPTTLLV